jgi:hypothetical protein
MDGGDSRVIGWLDEVISRRVVGLLMRRFRRAIGHGVLFICIGGGRNGWCNSGDIVDGGGDGGGFVHGLLLF